MKPPRETPDTDLASYLARRFGRGEAASSTAAGPSGTRGDSAASDGIDENDLAAFALGELPRGRRAVLSARLARDPAAREAVAFERALRPTPFLLRRRVVAAAAVLLLVALALPMLLRRGDPLEAARTRLANGATGEAVAILEAALDDDEGPTRSLLALARVAHGDADPARGLALSGEELELLPFTPSELAARDPGPRRQDPTTADLVVAPRGLLLAERPALRLLAADEELSARVLELESGTELARVAVPRRDAKLGARLAWPSGAPAPTTFPGPVRPTPRENRDDPQSHHRDGHGRPGPCRHQ